VQALAPGGGGAACVHKTGVIDTKGADVWDMVLEVAVEGRDMVDRNTAGGQGTLL
jgi:hypothetical protein